MTSRPALRSKFVFCLALALLGAVFKLWLIADSEIVDAVDDSHEYALQILYPANGGLAYPPGTGWVGRLFYEAKIPFRFGTEILFIAATALVLRALLKWPSQSFLSLALFLFIILDPNPAEEFTHLLSDQLWVIETMAGLSCIVLAWEHGPRPRWSYLSLAILLLGLSVLTRSTFIPLVISLLFFLGASLVFLFTKLNPVSLRAHLAPFVAVVLSLLWTLSLIYYGTCFLDWKRYGYFGVSAIDCREYRDFDLCLQSVGDLDQDTHFPIDEERRKLISQAGPTSAWFIGEIEKNRVYKQVGQDVYGKRDIPEGWFQFAAFDVLWAATQGDLRKAYALMGSIESEIAQAKHDGRLKVRWIFPLPDSRIPVVGAALPGGVVHTVQAVLYQPPAEAFAWSAEKNKYNNSLFSAALTRHVVEESPTQEEIWAVLCAIYPILYGLPLFFLFMASLFLFLVILALKAKPWEEMSLSFLAQQLFAIFFFVHLFWYALFDASGRCVFTRYVLLQHVLLPILTAYYLTVCSRPSKKSASSESRWRLLFPLPSS